MLGDAEELGAQLRIALARPAPERGPGLRFVLAHAPHHARTDASSAKSAPGSARTAASTGRRFPINSPPAWLVLASFTALANVPVVGGPAIAAAAGPTSAWDARVGPYSTYEEAEAVADDLLLDADVYDTNIVYTKYGWYVLIEYNH